MWNTYTNAQVRNVHIVCKYKHGEAVVRLDSLRPKHLETTIPRTRNKQTCSNRSEPINLLHINYSCPFEYQIIKWWERIRSRDECIMKHTHTYISIDRIHKHRKPSKSTQKRKQTFVASQTPAAHSLKGQPRRRRRWTHGDLLELAQFLYRESFRNHGVRSSKSTTCETKTASWIERSQRMGLFEPTPVRY